MSEYAEIWKFWYEAQMQELQYSRQFYSCDLPSLSPADPFDPSEDAEVLRKAMKGLGTNEEDIIKILPARSLDQRMQIQDKYQQIHGRDLVEDLKGELTGVFEKVILSLLKPLPLFFAEQIKNATKGAGTDEGALIEILCTRDDESIKTIKESFEKEYDVSLEEIICKEATRGFETTLMSILALCRDDTGVSPSERAEELASPDIDEAQIRKIVTSHTFAFLRKVFDEFAEKSEEDFEALVERTCSEDCRDAFKAIYVCSRSRTEYFARALNAAMEGWGTDDWALIRIIVSRCEIDLGTIKEKYTELFEKDLIEQVKDEISGDYAATLLSLLGVRE